MVFRVNPATRTQRKKAEERPGREARTGRRARTWPDVAGPKMEVAPRAEL